MRDGASGDGRSNRPSPAASGPAPSPPLLHVDGLTKRYGGIAALAGATLTVAPNTVHAVVGENGAGKSTLMRILAGVEAPDAGRVELDGRPVAFGSPAEARSAGIGIVFQELSLFPDRTVGANLFVNSEPSRYGFVSRREMRRLAAPVLERVGLTVDTEAKVSELQLGERQLVEICRVLLQRPRLIILDEPNSALTSRETERLFAVLRDLKATGVTAIYVSHRLEEVFQISDAVTVVRNGRSVLSADIASVTVPDVVGAMIGKGGFESLVSHVEHAAPTPDTPRLEVRDLRSDDLRGVSLTAFAGQIVGIAGLEGAGASPLLRLLFGLGRPEAGTVSFPDGKGLPRDPTSAARRGISMVPADRRNEGLMLRRPVAFNLAQVVLGALRARTRTVTRSLQAQMAVRQIERLRIVATPWAKAETLSGGNQQKVVLGKWLEAGPKVLLLDDPTRGVDIGAKREIYRLIRRLASEGQIVLVTSTELPELCELADRIVILYRGRVAGEFAPGEATPGRLLHAVNTGQLH